MHHVMQASPSRFLRVNQSDSQYMLNPADCQNKTAGSGSDNGQIVTEIAHVMNLAIANTSLSQKKFTSLKPDYRL